MTDIQQDILAILIYMALVATVSIYRKKRDGYHYPDKIND